MCHQNHFWKGLELIRACNHPSLDQKPFADNKSTVAAYMSSFELDIVLYRAELKTRSKEASLHRKCFICQANCIPEYHNLSIGMPMIF